MIGRTVSHYRILSRLGEGGMGVVYKAEDLRLARTVALKFLPHGIGQDSPARARFLNEARAAASLDHSSICHVWDIDQDGDRPFLVMSYIDGASLRDRLADGPLPVEEALRIAIQVADGLVDAHAQGIVHRDIKPSNILISADGKAKVTDFGLALLADQTRLTGAGLAVGTPLYMAPEQIGGGDVDNRADIWALGVVLHEMLTGRPPFRAEYRDALFYAILHLDPPRVTELRPEAPAELDLIAARALARRREERYADIAEMLGDLRRVRDRLVRADGASPPAWMMRLLKRRLALLAGVAIVAVAAAAAAVLHGRGGEPNPLVGARPMQVTGAPGWESEPRLSPDGSRIAFVSSEAGQRDVWVVAAEGGEPVRLTDDPADDYRPAWFPDGGSLAFVSERTGRAAIWRVGQLGGGATLLVDDAYFPAISPDGRRIAFSRLDDAGDLCIFVAPLDDPAAARQLTRTGEGLWAHRSPAWSPDGRTICYATHHDLWLVGADGKGARQLLQDGIYDSNPVWSPGGRWIYFDSRRDDNQALWRASVRGGSPMRLSLGSRDEQHVSLSVDGSRLAYSTELQDSDIAILDRRTGREVRIYDSQRSSMPAIAPDGSAVAFASERGGGRLALWVQPLVDGAPSGPPRRLNDQAGRASHPVWSPDGAWIAYYLIDAATGGRDIWTIPAAGGLPVQHTDDPAIEAQPAWSPDGRSLAFVSVRGSRSEIWIGAVEAGRPAGAPRRLDLGLATVAAPSWSPDGRWIAVMSEAERGGDVWLAPAQDGPARRLTHGAMATRVRWDADGAALLVLGRWGEAGISLRRVSTADGSLLDDGPLASFGSPRDAVFFDISMDGRYLALMRQDCTGDVWLLQAKKGAF